MELHKSWNDLFVLFDPEDWVDASSPSSGAPFPPLMRSVAGTHALPAALDRAFDSSHHPRFNLPHDVLEIATVLEDATLDVLRDRAERVARSMSAPIDWFQEERLPWALDTVREAYQRAVSSGDVVVCVID